MSAHNETAYRITSRRQLVLKGMSGAVVHGFGRGQECNYLAVHTIANTEDPVLQVNSHHEFFGTQQTSTLLGHGVMRGRNELQQMARGLGKSLVHRVQLDERTACLAQIYEGIGYAKNHDGSLTRIYWSVDARDEAQGAPLWTGKLSAVQNELELLEEDVRQGRAPMGTVAHSPLSHEECITLQLELLSPPSRMTNDYKTKGLKKWFDDLCEEKLQRQTAKEVPVSVTYHFADEAEKAAFERELEGPEPPDPPYQSELDALRSFSPENRRPPREQVEIPEITEEDIDTLFEELRRQ